MPPRSLARRSGLVLATTVIALLLLVVAYGYQSGALSRPFKPGSLFGRSGAFAAQAAAGSRSIQAFFTTPTLIYPDIPSQRPPSPLLQAVLADIDASRASVDLATFDFDVVEVADALLRAE